MIGYIKELRSDSHLDSYAMHLLRDRNLFMSELRVSARVYDIFLAMYNDESGTSVANRHGISPSRCAEIVGTVCRKLRRYVYSPSEDGIEALDLPTITYNALRRAGLFTISSIVDYIKSGKDLCSIKYIGKDGAEEIATKINKLGINCPYHKNNSVMVVIYDKSRNLYKSRKGGWGKLSDALIVYTSDTAVKLCSGNSNLVTLDVCIQLVNSR